MAQTKQADATAPTMSTGGWGECLRSNARLLAGVMPRSTKETKRVDERAIGSDWRHGMPLVALDVQCTRADNMRVAARHRTERVPGRRGRPRPA